LTGTEAQALDCLLRVDFPGATALREQAAIANVVGGCGCGCPTVDLDVDLSRSARAEADQGIVSSWVQDDEGGQLLLFVRGGKLSRVEVSWISEPPTSFPACEQVTPPDWQAGP
jgi:hypothetical protein